MRGWQLVLTGGAVLTLLSGAFRPVQAQRAGARVPVSSEFGIRAGRDFSVDSWTGGAHIRVPFGRMIELRPSADFALDDIGDDFQINADFALHGPRDQAYIGAGVGYVNRRFDSGEDSGTGLNLFLGFKPIPRPGSQIYLEGRWTLVDSETLFRIAMGVTVPL
jgi:hypothetical protein